MLITNTGRYFFELYFQGIKLIRSKIISRKVFNKKKLILKCVRNEKIAISNVGIELAFSPKIIVSLPILSTCQKLRLLNDPF